MKTQRRYRAGAMVLLALAGLSGCSRSSPEETAPASAESTGQELPPIVAETTLEALGKTGKAVPAGAPEAAAANPGSKPTPEFDAAFGEALKAYFAMRQTMASDSDAGVGEAAARFRTALEKVKAGPLPGATDAENEVIRQKLAAIDAAAGKLAGKELEADRAAFGEVSTPLMYLVAFHYHAAPDQQPFVYYCPMKELAWLQDVKAMGNPYYGSKMLTCGAVVPRADGSYRK